MNAKTIALVGGGIVGAYLLYKMMKGFLAPPPAAAAQLPAAPPAAPPTGFKVKYGKLDLFVPLDAVSKVISSWGKGQSPEKTVKQPSQMPTWTVDDCAREVLSSHGLPTMTSGQELSEDTFNKLTQAIISCGTKHGLSVDRSKAMKALLERGYYIGGYY